MSEHDDELPESLKRALERIDVKARAAAERVDVRRVTEGVLRDLKTGQGGRGARGQERTTPWLRVAAAAALIIGGTAMTAVMLNRNETPAIAGLPVNIDLLDASDSQAVRIAMEDVRAGSDTTLSSTTVTVDDLNEQELRALLQAMENEESL